MSKLQMPSEPPTSDGILLRPFHDTDVGMLRDLATDPYVPLIGTLPLDADERDALDFIARQHDRLDSGIGYSFCVADREDDVALGTAGLWIADLAVGRATVGYTVAPFARQRGVAVNALRALTTFGWTLPGLFRIELYVEPWNVGSLRTAEAAGYEREGLLRSHQPIGDRRADMFLFASLRPAGHPGHGPVAGAT
jgi:ribosomal-protein-alanine N-acetyltransferase